MQESIEYIGDNFEDGDKRHNLPITIPKSFRSVRETKSDFESVKDQIV